MFNTFKKEFKKCKIRFDQKILVAVSGGVDSMVLAHLMQESKYIFGIAHVNFSLRIGEADIDEEMVKATAKLYGVPFHSLKVDTKSYAKDMGISIQMAARDIRYDFFNQLFEESGYDSLATAHHLEDNFETFLLNLNRGTGIKGLTGISSNIERFRPLLSFSKDEIRTYASENEVKFREDKSNYETKYDRNWFRHEILTPWKKRNPSFLKIMKENFAHINEAFEIVEDEIEKNTKELKKELRKGYIKYATLKEIRRKKFYLFHLLSPLGFNNLQIRDLLSCIKQKQVGKMFNSIEFSLVVERKRVELLSKLESTVQEEYYLIEENSILDKPFGIHTKSIEKFMFENTKDSRVEVFDKSKLKFPLYLRKWKAGDKMKPLGMKGSKKISDLLSDKKTSKANRKNAYVLLSEDKIIWLLEHRIDERFKVTKNTSELILISLK